MEVLPEETIFAITSFLHCYEVYLFLNTCKILQSYATSKILLAQLALFLGLPVSNIPSLFTLCQYERCIIDENYVKLLSKVSKEGDIVLIDYLLHNIIDKPKVVVLAFVEQGKYEEALKYSSGKDKLRISYSKRLSKLTTITIIELLNSNSIPLYSLVEELIRRNELQTLDEVIKNYRVPDLDDIYFSMITHFIRIGDQRRYSLYLPLLLSLVRAGLYDKILELISYECKEMNRLEMIKEIHVSRVPAEVLYKVKKYATKTNNKELLNYIADVPQERYLSYVKYEEFTQHKSDNISRLFDIAIESKVDKRRKVEYVSQTYQYPNISQIRYMCQDDKLFELLKEFYFSRSDFNARVYLHSLFTYDTFGCCLSLAKWIAETYTGNLLTKAIRSLVITLNKYREEKRIDKMSKISSFLSERENKIN